MTPANLLMAPNPNIEQVRILNSELATHYYLYVRGDRVREFYAFITADRKPDLQPSPIPGLSWSAVLGLDAIFAKRPRKFPTHDLLVWLRDSQKGYLGEYPNPTITLPEIENALERFSAVYPPDVAAEGDA